MSLENSLDEIGVKYKTDKSSIYHDFLRFYEHHLPKSRHEKLKILEIGVYDGASLKMWADYYPESDVTAIDINKDCEKYNADRQRVIIADQSDIDQISTIARDHGPFDIIIDDGSHYWDHQITSLQYLFPHLKEGGTYIMEDIDTSFGEVFSRDYCGMSNITAVDYIKKILDYMIGDRVLDISKEPDAFIRSYARKIDTISFFRRTSVLKKK